MPQVLAEVPLTARVMDNGCIEILGMEDLPQDAPCLWASCSNAGFTVCATAAVQSSLYVLNGLIGGTQDLLKAKVMARMAQAQMQQQRQGLVLPGPIGMNGQGGLA